MDKLRALLSSFLTLDLYLQPVLLGVALGYILRIIEHTVHWRLRGGAPAEDKLPGWAILVLPQCLLFGAGLGYTTVALFHERLATQAPIVAFLVSALFAFLSVDLRDLVRRITRI